jgi:dienelactone hydrolase
MPVAVIPPIQPSALTKSVTIERVHSAARGKDVELILMAPEGVPTAGLPVCVALHGRYSNARQFLGLGLPAVLTEAVRAGTPPFVMAALDGDHYWTVSHSGDDPQRMLNEELPQWLTQRSLPATPVAAYGISMGGFGALEYARGKSELRAVAACSPALFTNWTDAKARKVFDDRQEWEAAEPSRYVSALQSKTVGVWCGSSDSFAPAAKKFAQELPAAVTDFTTGAHNDRYWKKALPDIVRFVGAHLS